jgi:predicted DNA-binding transcriptional regulator AlpA
MDNNHFSGGVNLVVLTPEQLTTLIREAIAGYLGASATSSQQSSSALLSRAACSNALGISVASLDRICNDGCPFITIGKSRRFDLAAVREWLATREQPEKTVRKSGNVSNVTLHGCTRLSRVGGSK